jgi:multidrug efflux system membrane fusion protein
VQEEPELPEAPNSDEKENLSNSSSDAINPASEPPFYYSKMGKIWSVVAVIVLVIVTRLYFVGSASDSSHPSVSIPVVTAAVQAKNMPIYVSALGTVTPTDTVTVKTQIDGQLIKVLFEEGQTVKAGELLAEIDSRPTEAQLAQFEGQLARDLALLDNARIDLERYKKLYSQDAVSQQTLDTQISLVNQYEGTVASDRGQVESAKVNLIYCRITSPINGRVGLRQVDPGNFVQTTDTNGLFVINTIQPITVIFSIPEDNLPEVIKKVVAGNILNAEAYDRAQNKLLATGKLLTFDNQIDPTTGTIKLRAQFINDNLDLFPNQFVNVKLFVDILKDALVIPTSAVQRGKSGTFVYVVNADQTVNTKPVTIRSTNGDMVAVDGALLVNQLVIIEGADKLREGTKVAPVPANTNNISVQQNESL